MSGLIELWIGFQWCPLSLHGKARTVWFLSASSLTSPLTCLLFFSLIRSQPHVKFSTYHRVYHLPDLLLLSILMRLSSACRASSASFPRKPFLICYLRYHHHHQHSSLSGTVPRHTPVAALPCTSHRDLFRCLPTPAADWELLDNHRSCFICLLSLAPRTICGTGGCPINTCGVNVWLVLSLLAAPPAFASSFPRKLAPASHCRSQRVGMKNKNKNTGCYQCPPAKDPQKHTGSK